MQMIERCHALEAKMRKLQTARLNVSNRNIISLRREDWNMALEPIERGCRQLQWLGMSPDCDPGLAQSLVATRALAVEARARLIETRDIDSVRTSDALWTRLLASAKNCGEALAAAVQRHWSEAVRNHGDFDSVETIRQRAPSTPGNRDALEDYQRAYTAYQMLAGAKGPRFAQSIDQLAQRASELRSALSRIDFNVPPEVQAFFSALSAGGAKLELITPTLLDWLKSNDQLNHYVVRKRNE